MYHQKNFQNPASVELIQLPTFPAIREVFGSNLDRDTGYPDEGFVVSSDPSREIPE
jgi:hypothetical protein